VEARPHPAKFSAPILEVLRDIIPEGARVLDPMAGVGLIHSLEGRKTVGIELEPWWACAHPRTMVGNCKALPFPDHSWPWVVTSPTYANRMADHHDAKERCRACAGTGEDLSRAEECSPECDGSHQVDGRAICPRGPEPCPKCEGKGRRDYKRLTYRHQYGEDLHPDSSATLQWGPKYRAFQVLFLAEVARVLAEEGRFVLNLKNHWREKAVARVVEWHLSTMLSSGWELLRIEPVEVDGMGFGANREAREGCEFVMVFRRNLHPG
jgi:hypothetical protein